ncbi:hypothetical protein, partial [Streptomyces alanosinicus]|uniref:hypothetical protein n=1 Tax=Streptomyces alanosinicus TaxID=68171 RepID=UPI001E43C926
MDTRDLPPRHEFGSFGATREDGSHVLDEWVDAMPSGPAAGQAVPCREEGRMVSTPLYQLKAEFFKTL